MDIFIIPLLHNIHYSNRRRRQKIAPGREKVLTLQKPVRVFEKKIQNIIPRQILGKVTRVTIKL